MGPGVTDVTGLGGTRCGFLVLKTMSKNDIKEKYGGRRSKENAGGI